MNEHGIPIIRECEVVQVIRTVHARGKGVWGDPVREVVTFWSTEGERLAESDPVGEENAE